VRNWLTALCLLSGASSAAGDAPGLSILSIAVNGPRLSVGLDGPVANFIGFEHAPVTPAQTAQLARAVEVLGAGSNLVLTPPEAYCRMDSASVSPPAYKDAPGAGPARLAASWQFLCSSPAALIWIDARVLASFPNTARLATSVVTPSGRKAVVLTPGTTRVLLPRPAANSH
jgi:hypothetical protein